MRVWLGYTEMETAGPSAPVGMTRGEWVFLWIGYGMNGTADPSASLGMTKGRVGCQ
jgi:hypothetical protein